MCDNQTGRPQLHACPSLYALLYCGSRHSHPITDRIWLSSAIAARASAVGDCRRRSAVGRKLGTNGEKEAEYSGGSNASDGPEAPADLPGVHLDRPPGGLWKSWESGISVDARNGSAARAPASRSSGPQCAPGWMAVTPAASETTVANEEPTVWSDSGHPAFVAAMMGDLPNDQQETAVRARGWARCSTAR
jgi:hypothetical protein